MSKNIFIHIGPHKTGTTTIQKGLWINREQLKENNYLCPKSGQPFPQSAGTHNLAWQLGSNKNFTVGSGTWDDLVDEIGEKGQPDNMILSSEAFSNLSFKEIKIIKKKLKLHNVKIIIYLRRQDQALQSLWFQVVQNYSLQKVPYFYEWMEENKYQHKHVDYQKIIADWMEIFGKENIILRVLEKSQLKTNLFCDFLDACGIENCEAYSAPPDWNVSPGIKTVEAIRLSRDILSPSVDRGVWRKITKQITGFGEKNKWNETKMNLIDSELYRKIMENFNEANQEIARNYFSRDELFSEPFSAGKIESFHLDDFQNEEIIDLFSYIISGLLNVTDWRPKPEKVNRKRASGKGKKIDAGKRRPKGGDAKDLRTENSRLRADLQQIYASRSYDVYKKIDRFFRKFKSGRNAQK